MTPAHVSERASCCLGVRDCSIHCEIEDRAVLRSGPGLRTLVCIGPEREIDFSEPLVFNVQYLSEDD